LRFWVSREDRACWPFWRSRQAIITWWFGFVARVWVVA
jgi:hypothetical protein